ncbi:HupE/UreJ family protein [Hansschlegelia quercus]|uniref:HupE/UreJ family protein n=1 Tax=Hansschlegelia quercus TaxID=2528245 RepID=A0A4Q9GKM3_9HYPH|nr:HupE/UreJ family protein [Hansschlegelia quercus]TBN54752.1 HupE/UreJ family protein [Hansschlegelia quercus]
MRRALLALSVLLVPTAAYAHVGVGATNGFAHGVLHPVSGIDHILTMVAVGVFAAQLGGRAIWAVPSAFVGMMIAGGALGMSGVEIPFVESGIGLSVVALGLAVAFGLSVPVTAATALVGFFAIFHGHAHGVEMPDTASGLGYGAGFVVATAMLHMGGIGLGLAVGKGGTTYGPRITQVAGGAMTVAGVAILGGVL